MFIHFRLNFPLHNWLFYCDYPFQSWTTDLESGLWDNQTLWKSISYTQFLSQRLSIVIFYKYPSLYHFLLIIQVHVYTSDIVFLTYIIKRSNDNLVHEPLVSDTLTAGGVMLRVGLS